MMNMEENNLATRYNINKIKYSLVPHLAHKEMAAVFTFGAKKYSANNWRKGLPFSTCLDSLQRHIESFKNGEDIDPESGLLHLGHMMCNVAFLIEFLTTHPELDDRVKPNKIIYETINVERGIKEEVDEGLLNGEWKLKKRIPVAYTPF